MVSKIHCETLLGINRQYLDQKCTGPVPTSLMWNLPLLSHKPRIVWLLLCSLSLLWLSTAWPQDFTALFPTLFLLLQLWPETLLFWIFPPFELILLACSLCPVFNFSSFIVCISFILLCPSPVPTSHLQPGQIRYLVSWVTCPLGAFWALDTCVHDCIKSETSLWPGCLT